MRLRSGLAAAALVAGLAGGTKGAEPRRYEYAEPHMGTAFTLVLYSDDEALASRASRLAFDRIKALDATLTDYDPDSELMRLCDRAGGGPVAVGPDLFAVVARAKGIWERSGGALDPTIAPVVRLWRRARRERKLPDPALIARARALVGAEAIRLDPAARTIELARPGMKLDLGAIAKGYASGEAIASLKAAGIASALVAGSGDIVVSGPPPGRAGWTIAVAPLADASGGGPLGPTVTLRDAAISTSGDAEQFVEIGGVRYSHVIDPTTGIGLTDRRSVTVIAPDGALADGLDTAACILGPERGLKLIESTPHAAALFVRIAPGGAEIVESNGWASYKTKPARP